MRTTRIPAADYLTWRFALATAVLAALRPRGVVAMPTALRRKALLLGLVFGVANLLLTVGLTSTSASVSGFLTATYVIFTPLLTAALFREHLRRQVWTATAVAAVGLAVLSTHGGGGTGSTTGAALTLAGAALFAVHIVGLGAWSHPRYAVEMAVYQAGMTALVSAVAAIPGGIEVPRTSADRFGLIYMAVVVGALTMLVQTWAQSRIHPARAAIVMTFEPVWAAGFAICLGGEQLTGQMLAGGVLVLGAMYLVERH